MRRTRGAWWGRRTQGVGTRRAAASAHRGQGEERSEMAEADSGSAAAAHVAQVRWRGRGRTKDGGGGVQTGGGSIGLHRACVARGADELKGAAPRGRRPARSLHPRTPVALPLYTETEGARGPQRVPRRAAAAARSSAGASGQPAAAQHARAGVRRRERAPCTADAARPQTCSCVVARRATHVCQQRDTGKGSIERTPPQTRAAWG